MTLYPGSTRESFSLSNLSEGGWVGGVRIYSFTEYLPGGIFKNETEDCFTSQLLKIIKKISTKFYKTKYLSSELFAYLFRKQVLYSYNDEDLFLKTFLVYVLLHLVKVIRDQ